MPSEPETLRQVVHGNFGLVLYRDISSDGDIRRPLRRYEFGVADGNVGIIIVMLMLAGLANPCK